MPIKRQIRHNRKIIRKFEDTAMKTIQKETYRKKKNTEKNKTSVRCGQTSSDPICIIRVPKEMKGRQKKYLKD